MFDIVIVGGGPYTGAPAYSAMAAYRAFHLRDYGRIDIRVRGDQPYVLDVNSNPDITIDGGFAKTAAVAGYDYGAMASRIVNLAARRRPIAV